MRPCHHSERTGEMKRPLYHYILLAILSVVCFCIYFSKTGPAVEGGDPMGYVYAGRHLARSHSLSYCDSNNELAGPYFHVNAFRIRRGERGCLGFNYPPGFPLLLAAVFQAGLALYVVPFLAVLGVLGTYCLGRLLFDNQTGLWAAAIVAFAPAYLLFSTAPWSDVPGTVFILWGVAAFIAAQHPTRGQGFRIALSSLAGLLLSYSFFIRYTSMVLIFPLLVYTLYVQRGRAFRDTVNFFFFPTLGLGVLALLLYNKYYYGGFFTTGYSPQHGWYPWPMLDFAYWFGPSPVGGKSFPAACRTILTNFPLISPFILIGALTMPRPKALLLMGIAFIIVLFYSFYAFAPTGVNARFLLPVFPMLGLMGSFGLVKAVTRVLKGNAAPLVIPLCVLAAIFYPALEGFREIEIRDRNLAITIEQVQSFTQNTEENAVFLSYIYNDVIAFYGPRSVLNYRNIPPSDPATGTYREEVFEPRLVKAVDTLLENDIPVYYLKDMEPSLLNSFEILNKHFHVPRYSEQWEIYKVQK